MTDRRAWFFGLAALAPLAAVGWYAAGSPVTAPAADKVTAARCCPDDCCPGGYCCPDGSCCPGCCMEKAAAAKSAPVKAAECCPDGDCCPDGPCCAADKAVAVKSASSPKAARKSDSCCPPCPLCP
jgi:hypothetical protein